MLSGYLNSNFPLSSAPEFLHMLVYTVVDVFSCTQHCNIERVYRRCTSSSLRFLRCCRKHRHRPHLQYHLGAPRHQPLSRLRGERKELAQKRRNCFCCLHGQEKANVKLKRLQILAYETIPSRYEYVLLHIVFGSVCTCFLHMYL